MLRRLRIFRRSIFSGLVLAVFVVNVVERVWGMKTAVCLGRGSTQACMRASNEAVQFGVNHDGSKCFWVENTRTCHSCYGCTSSLHRKLIDIQHQQKQKGPVGFIIDTVDKSRQYFRTYDAQDLSNVCHDICVAEAKQIKEISCPQPTRKRKIVPSPYYTHGENEGAMWAEQSKSGQLENIVEADCNCIVRNNMMPGQVEESILFGRTKSFSCLNERRDKKSGKILRQEGKILLQCTEDGEVELYENTCTCSNNNNIGSAERIPCGIALGMNDASATIDGEIISECTTRIAEDGLPQIYTKYSGTCTILCKDGEMALDTNSVHGYSSRSGRSYKAVLTQSGGIKYKIGVTDVGKAACVKIQCKEPLLPEGTISAKTSPPPTLLDIGGVFYVKCDTANSYSRRDGRENQPFGVTCELNSAGNAAELQYTSDDDICVKRSPCIAISSFEEGLIADPDDDNACTIGRTLNVFGDTSCVVKCDESKGYESQTGTYDCKKEGAAATASIICVKKTDIDPPQEKQQTPLLNMPLPTTCKVISSFEKGLIADRDDENACTIGRTLNVFDDTSCIVKCDESEGYKKQTGTYDCLEGGGNAKASIICVEKTDEDPLQQPTPLSTTQSVDHLRGRQEAPKKKSPMVSIDVTVNPPCACCLSPSCDCCDRKRAPSKLDSLIEHIRQLGAIIGTGTLEPAV